MLYKYPTSNPITYRKFHQISHEKIPINIPISTQRNMKNPHKYPIKKLPSPTKKTNNESTELRKLCGLGRQLADQEFPAAGTTIPMVRGKNAVRRTSERGWMTG